MKIAKDLSQRIIMIFAFLGIVDSAYLTWLKFGNKQAACSGFGECDIVNSSVFAEFGGVPIALIGLVGYVVILIFGFLESSRYKIGQSSPLVIFGLCFVGLLFSIYLTYIEIYVLDAICPFCVISALIMLVLFIASVFRLRDKYIEVI